LLLLLLLLLLFLVLMTDKGIFFVFYLITLL